jgi:hypothetical protein
MAAFAKGRKKTGGRQSGVRNKRTLAAQPKAHPDALDHLAGVVASKNPNITAELKVRAAAALAQYQHPRPTASRAETFVHPIDYVKPQSVDEARETILTLGERLARAEVSIQAHDALVGGLRAYLGDKAAEQQRELDPLKEALEGNEND